MSSRFVSLFVPLMIALFSLYLSVYVEQVPSVWLVLIDWLPHIFAVIVVLLAWHFNKGLIFLACLTLGLPLLPFPSLGNQANLSVYLLVSAMILSLIACLPERGFFNRFALNRMIFIGMLLLWCVALQLQWLNVPGVSRFLISLHSFSIALIVFALVFIACIFLLLGFWWYKADTFSGALLVSLLLLTLMNLLPLSANQLALLHAGIFLIWGIYLLIDSHKMAYMDDLTQLPGRRAFNEKMQSLSKRYVIAMLDVDHFKKFNDAYGHDMGDKVLKLVAQQMFRVTSGGKAFRYGGEEFAIVFTNVPKADVTSALEEVREEIAAQKIDIHDSKKDKTKSVSVTISIGAAVSHSGDRAQDVMKQADQLLYKAKKKGRNCLIIE